MVHNGRNVGALYGTVLPKPSENTGGTSCYVNDKFVTPLIKPTRATYSIFFKDKS